MPAQNHQLAAALTTALDKFAIAYPGGRQAANPRLAIDVYCTALDGVHLDSIERATSRWLKSAKFFPKPAELREVCESIMREDYDRRPPWVKREAQQFDERTCRACGIERIFRRFVRPIDGNAFDRMTCRCEAEDMVKRRGWQYLGDSDEIDPLPTGAALWAEAKRRMREASEAMDLEAHAERARRRSELSPDDQKRALLASRSA